ncbi:G-protein coupled receptor Mth2-like [Arctopsyche grandis]|uniref:G-protein coupled receptor Mth2-like n=1 Tax=Arctopsyche grandis TaxID=121162 RepID=UPI00406D8227
MSRRALLLLAATCCLAPAPTALQLWDAQGLSHNAPSSLTQQPDRRTDSRVANLLVQLYAENYEGEAPAELPGRRRRENTTPNSPPADSEDPQNTTNEDRKIAVVGKCCPIGQNLTVQIDEYGNRVRECTPSTLVFQPFFYDFNETALWSYDMNVWETIVANPCQYGRYKLDPIERSEDEFYLLTNGSLVAPYHQPRMLGPKDFCMEVFWFPDMRGSDGLSLPLVCFPAPSASTEDGIPSNTRLVIIAIVMLVSVPFLCVTAAAYFITPELRNSHGKSLATHCVCLAIAYLALACTQLAGPQSNTAGCFVAAVIIQFSFLACFCWLTLVCFDTYQNIRKLDVSTPSANQERSRFVFYNIFGWGVPILLMVITSGMELAPSVPLFIHKPNFGAKGCWFQTDLSALIYFYGPVTVLLLVNVLLFVLTCFSNGNDPFGHNETASQRMCMPSSNSLRADDISNDTDIFQKRKNKYKKLIKKSFMLSMAMGMSWLLEIISWILGGSDWSWIAFDMFNASQGLVIFYIYVWKNPSDIHKSLLKHFPWLKCVIPKDMDSLSPTVV